MIVKSSTLVSVITVQDLMSQSQRLVNVWYEPIEILTATAAIYIAFVFLISLTGKLLADRLRRRYGLARVVARMERSGMRDQVAPFAFRLTFKSRRFGIQIV